jgi:uncharacterized membrane protein (DUF4010 family)
MNQFVSQFLSLDLQKLLLVLILSFLLGLEREEHTGAHSFGGIRTFPLIGLIGFILALVTNNNPVAIAIGLVVIALFMLFSYKNKLDSKMSGGVTTEMSALFVYLIGVLISAEHFWLAVALVVFTLLLLELKDSLEGLAKGLPSGEVLTFTKFLLLAAVILPALPNEPLTVFQINPFHTWLIIVAICTMSYGSYILQKIIGNKRGVFLSAVLGGAYSSTVTTIVLAQRSKTQPQPQLFSGSMLAASGVMYLRLALLLCIFSEPLRAKVSPFLFALGLIAILCGYLWTKKSENQTAVVVEEAQPKNPLELTAAFLFAFLFLLMLIVTGLVLKYLGTVGVYVLALITGVTDVDPFIMGLTQSAGANTPVLVAAIGIIIAAASNNIAKGAYAYFFAKGRAGREGLIFLSCLAAAGLLPLIYICYFAKFS